MCPVCITPGWCVRRRPGRCISGRKDRACLPVRQAGCALGELGGGMAHEQVVNATPVEIPTKGLCKRRRYNREYMRKWRSKPMNREMERKSRGWYCERKPRNEGQESPRSMAGGGVRLLRTPRAGNYHPAAARVRRRAWRLRRNTHAILRQMLMWRGQPLRVTHMNPQIASSG